MLADHLFVFGLHALYSGGVIMVVADNEQEARTFVTALIEDGWITYDWNRNRMEITLDLTLDILPQAKGVILSNYYEE